MALRLSGIKFLPPERTYSSLQIGKFPFAYRGLKIIPDFQRRLEGDEPEPLEVVPWALNNLAALFSSGECTEARSIAALYMARDYCEQ
jgi:hypothetical protein